MGYIPTMADSQAQKPKVVLHWLEKSRSQRILWLLQECKGLDWEVKTYKRQPNMLAPPALKEVHPLGKSPVITVEAPALSKPMVVAESAAICEYLCDHFAPHLVPKRYKEGQEGQVGGETEEWLRYRFYMHYAEGSLMTLLLLTLFMDSQSQRRPSSSMVYKAGHQAYRGSNRLVLPETQPQDAF